MTQVGLQKRAQKFLLAYVSKGAPDGGLSAQCGKRDMDINLHIIYFFFHF